MAVVSLTSATAGQVLTASFYNNNNNAIINQVNGNLDSNNLANLSVTSGKLVTGSVTGSKIAMGSDAQGDTLFRGAANYERLGAGTNGQFLMTQGAGANPKWDWSGLVQVVNYSTGAVATGTTILPMDDTIPQNTEGDQYLSLSITPKSASNNLYIHVEMQISNNNANTYGGIALFQDSTANALASTMTIYAPSQASGHVSLSYFMAAGTTSATTFKVRAGYDLAGTTTINGYNANRKHGGTLLSSITIFEVK